VGAALPFVEKRQWTTDEEDAVFVILDPLLFALHFWSDDLTIPNDRPDLPARWVGEHIISKEQRIMALDGADYMLIRDVLPEVVSISSQRVALRTSRKIAKTVYLEARIVQIPLTKTKPGLEEGMVHAPGEPHIAPVRDRVIRRIDRTPLFNMMHEKFDQTRGIQTWKTGATSHWRIEGLSTSAEMAGRSMVGLRAQYMLGDEADFSQVDFYTQRDQTAMPTCFQYWGGVPRGFRGIFWKICNTREGQGWSIHRYDMRANPLYHSQRAWDDQIKGDYYSQRVQTQVLGLDGEEAISSFPVIPVDATIPYHQRLIDKSDVISGIYGLDDLLAMPVRAVRDAESFLIAMDYGYAPSPSEIGIAYRKGPVWYTLGRLEMLHVDTFPCAELLVYLDQKILPQPADLVMIDAHGQGAGVLSALHTNPTWTDLNYIDRAMDVGFAGTTRLQGIFMHKKCRTVVQNTGQRDGMWRCDHCQQAIYDINELTEATLQTKIYLTNELKESFAQGERFLTGNTKWPTGNALVLGEDEQVIAELRGTTEVQRQSTVHYSSATDREHCTDMLRCLMSAIIRDAEAKRQEAVASVDEFGWVDAEQPVLGQASTWIAPWE